MTDSYFTENQMKRIKDQGERLGPEKILEVEREWPQLIAKVKREVEKGTDPKDPTVKKLARRWMELLKEFSGGDPGIEQSLKKKYKGQGDQIKQQYGGNVPGK